MDSNEIKTLWSEWKDRKCSVARVVAPALMNAYKNAVAQESGAPTNMTQPVIDNAIKMAQVAETFADPEPQNGVNPTIRWNSKTASFIVNYW